MSTVLPLSIDEVLTTTRAVRRRLDTTRPVDPDLILECLALAQQAPSASDSQPFHFVVVTDKERRAAMADLVRRGLEVYATMPANIMDLHYADDAAREAARLRIIDSVGVLLDKLEEIPVWVVPCLEVDLQEVPPMLLTAVAASVIPAAWSYMLAARSRGLGTCWMNIHQFVGPEADEIFGIPAGVTQVSAIATAHTIGTDFKPGYRRPLEEIVHWQQW